LIVQDLGEVQLKNIAERVRVYSLRVSKAPADIPPRVGSKRVWLALGALGVAAAAAGLAVLFFSNHTPQLASGRADLPLSCTSLKEYSDRSKAKNAQLMSTPVGDNTLQCDLKRDVLQSSQAVYMILEDDPQKCGVRDEVIDRVKTANDILLKNIQGQCGSIPQR
jgi:hypothetical protein